MNAWPFWTSYLFEPVSRSYLTSGHILVIPKDHVKNISDLSSSQSAALMQTVVAVAQIMEKGTSTKVLT